jgi:DNA polymerase-3 subunit epsilon
MKLLIFDTETTGLPESRNPAVDGPNNWPHLVSISWVVLDSTINKIEKVRNYVIKPIDWIIPAESTSIHGITHDEAVRYGSDLSNVITEFMSEQCDAMVAHNMDFDINVLTNAILWDLRLPYPVYPRQLCTMKLGRAICKLPGTFGRYKYPKLKEFYQHVFQTTPDESRLHSSMYDVMILTEIIQLCVPLRQAMGLVTGNVLGTSNGIYKNNPV